MFVNNIPFVVDAKWLFGIFERCGRVEEVFIPFKRNKAGKKFGFVRFKEESAADEAVRQFNRVWLLDHCLGVNWARYDRRSNFYNAKGDRNSGT